MLEIFDIDEGCCVAPNCFGKKCLIGLRSSAEELLYTHAIFCQRPRLVGADDGDGSHRFAGVHSPDEVVAAHHTAHAIGQGEADTHRKTFGYSHDDDRDGKHDLA